MKIGNFLVSNTRGSTKDQHVVRVKSCNRVKLVEVFVGQLDPDAKGLYDPYGFVVRNPCSRSHQAFVQQLQDHGVSEKDIRTLLQIDYKGN